ncbi:hypothetical protein GXB81_14015 [Paraburkholderia sp. Ac-20336]|uniref:hypothetical protein n=1 Tax=Paraburkholderia sp. Ac-20336 TaxID=2703886 RepID=UPI001981D9AC|nr:hypothetical protein [Paraburkholderia sp. Ac-20336]MBN3804156.1 hypothetical protein [Paraburkholderia sp. Ac-20336]
MQVGKPGLLAFVTFAALSGCASSPPPSAYVGGLFSAPSNDPATKRLSTAYNDLVPAGQASIVTPGLFTIRECNAGRCAEGVVKPVIDLTVEKIAQGKATVRAFVHGDIGKSQVIRSQTPVSTSEITQTVDNGVPLIVDQFSVVRVVTVTLGQIHQVPLPHDLRAHICVSVQGENGMHVGCDFSRLQTDENFEASTPML